MTAATHGGDFGIKSNVIIPAAVTRMSAGIDTSKFPPMAPEMVAPAVAWLCHEQCSISGEMLVAMGGRVARAFIAESEGVYRPDWTIEQVAAPSGPTSAGVLLVVADRGDPGAGQYLHR